jgi:hypothetical protein
MKAWIVGGILVAGILLAEPRSSHAQAQAGSQAAAQAQAASQQAAPQGQILAAAARSQEARPPAPGPGQQRDPFRPIVIERPAQAVDIVPNCTQAGMAGTLIGQVQLQGIASDVEGRWIAVVGNKTGRAYFLRDKDPLCNGIVTRVDQDALVMEERTLDSFGRTRTREVILRPAND